MRILFFYFTEFSLVGGVETVIVSMAKALKERGHDTGILDLAPAERPRRLVYGDIPIWSIAGPSFPTLRRPRSWASYLRSLWQFEKVCQEFRPDIVHVHFPLGQCIPLTGARVLPHRWRVVTTVHNSDIRISPHSEPRLRPWQERLFRMSNAVTSVSESLLA